MALTSGQVLLVAVLGLLAARAPEAAARKQKPSQPLNTRFTSCNTGTSRIVLANLDKLSADCRPAHNHLAAAIYACFATSKVKVENCQVTIHPSGKAAKTNPICKAVHAQGMLQAPSNASLVGIINQAKFTKFMTEHPDAAGSADAAAFQQLCAATLAQLFGRTVLLQGKSRCSSSAATGHKIKDTKGSKDHNSGGGVETSAAAPDSPVPGRRRPGRHKKGTGAAATTAAAGNGTSDASAAVASAAVAVSNATNTTAAVGPNETAAGPNDTAVDPNNTAAGSNSTAADPNNTAAAAAGNSSTAIGAISSNTTAGANSTSSNGSSAAVLPAAAAPAQPGTGTGHRKLLFDIGQQEQQQPQLLSRHLLQNSTKAAVAETPCTDDTAYDPNADFQAALANDSSSTGNAQGSVLYLQGSDDVILQPIQQCRFQYLVTKNPNLLQPTGKPSSRAAPTAPAAAAAARRVEAGGGGVDVAVGGGAVAKAGEFGHVAWIVFSSASVVLGAAVVYMVVKLVARQSDSKQRYDALQTSEPAAMAASDCGTVQLVPTAARGDQRDQQQRPDSAGSKAAAGAGHELSDTASRGDKTRLVKDNRRGDGSTATGK